MARKRTTSRSRSNKKGYTIRDARGRFKDNQSYKRAHGSDIKRRAADED
jgi:DNA-binding protein HU-beta